MAFLTENLKGRVVWRAVYGIGLALSATIMLAGCQSAGSMVQLADQAGQGGGQAAYSLAKGSLRADGERRSGLPNGGQRQNIASLDKILQNDPGNVSALNLRAPAYAKLGRLKQAYNDFSAAISNDPQYYQAYANRALVLVKMKRPREAMADYQRALEIRPDYIAALLGRASLYRQSRIYARALADYGRVIQIDPSNDIAYYQRAVTYQLMGRHQNAISDFDIAIGLRPAASEPFFGRGQSRFALGQYEKAYDDFASAAHRGKHNVRAWTYRGLAAEKFGDLKKARRAYLRAIQINPHFRPANQGLQRVNGAA